MTKAPYVYTSAEVELSPDEIKRHGYHHDSECQNTKACAHQDEAVLEWAVQQLHEQVHNRPGDSHRYDWCTHEPCRSAWPGHRNLQAVSA